MASKKQRKQSTSPFNPHSFDDGVDPRRYFQSHQHSKPNRKALQLCSQAREALNTALAGECSDPFLQGVFVSNVSPASGSNRLVVHCELEPEAGVTAALVLERLERTRGLLRSAVAGAICRRRAPDLEFRVAPPQSSADETNEEVDA